MLKNRISSMLTSNFSRLSEYMNESAVSKLIPFLESLSKGKDVDLYSPLYKGIIANNGRLEIIKKWVDDNVDNLSFPGLLELEKRELAKFSAFSSSLPWKEVKENYYNSYYTRPSFNEFDKICMERAVSKVKSLLPQRRLRPISFENAFSRMKKTTQFGLPYFASKQNETEARRYLDLSVNLFEQNKFVNYPCVAGNRLQQSGDAKKPKQRLVWIYSHVVSIIESIYSYPLIDFVSDIDEFIQLKSSDKADEFISQIFAKCSQNDSIISIDFDRFDSTISKEMIILSFEILKSCFQEDPKTSFFMDEICKHFYSSSLITPEGIWEGREGGVPSGSNFTNLIDSIVQLIAFYYCVFRNDLNESNCSVTVHGDDGVWYCSGLTLDLVVKSVSELNLVVNPSKVMFSPNACSFCQRHFHRNYTINGVNRGVRSCVRTFCGACFYERIPNRSVWSDKMDSIRFIMQLENNKYHPQFQSFIKFIKDGDEKYSLGTKISGGVSALFRSEGGQSSIENKLSSYMYIPTQSWANKSINNLEVIKVINSFNHDSSKRNSGM